MQRMNFKSLLLVAVVLLAASERAFGDDTFSDNGFKYQLFREANTVMVVGYECQSAVSPDSVLHIPASVTYDDNTFRVVSIGKRAFAGLTCIRSVVMDESIEFINEEAFSGCVNLQSVYIPASVEAIDERLFAGCHSLTKIVVDPNNKDFDSRANSNAIIDSQKNELLAGCSATTIPSSVRSIGNWAFGYCSDIKALVIPEGVETIGHCAFEGCSSLRYVYLPQSLRKIGSAVFSECGSLESLVIPKNVESICGDYLLNGCKNLCSITVDKDNPVFDSRSDCNGIVMKSDSSLIAACPVTTVVEGIGKLSKGCFSGLDIHNVSLPRSVTYIAPGAFSGCNEIESVSVDAGNPVYASPTGSNAILTKDCTTLVMGCRNTVIPDGVTELGNKAFYGRAPKELLRLPDGLRRIGVEAFSYSSGIIQLIIPRSVTEIGVEAFKGCSNLATLQMLCPLDVIRPRTFADCIRLSVVSLPDGIKKISEDAFSGCPCTVSIKEL